MCKGSKGQNPVCLQYATMCKRNKLIKHPNVTLWNALLLSDLESLAFSLLCEIR